MPDGTAYDPYPGQTSTTGGPGSSGNSNNTGYNWSGYAEWLAKTKNSTKTCNLIVNYYANGYNGSAAENPPPSSVRSYTGQSVDVRLVVEVASGDTMSNPGYVFVGWATSNNTATITYNPGDTISNSWAADYRGNSVTNLYAVWTNQNVITYNPDDNSIEKSAIYQVKQSGQSATLKGATFTRTGYTQTGWATTAGGPKVYNLGGTYSSNNPLSLYPVWQANTYTITYVANEGTGTMADQTVTYDSTFTPRACSFTREGYSFSSWNESQDGKGIRWKVQEYTVDRAENITLYAIWKGNEYTVYYDDNYSRYSDEITGDIVTFESGYAQPLKKAEVSLSPIQDLHGYSSPWPAGGGVNKFDISLYNLISPWINVSGVITNVDAPMSSSYNGCGFSGRGTTTLLAGTYTLSLKARLVSGEYTAGKFNALRLHTNGANVKDFQKFLNPMISNEFQLYYGTLTLEESYTFEDINLQFSTGLSNAVFEIKEIQIELNATPTAYSPYSNICPISGRTGLSVYRTGKNLLDVESRTIAASQGDSTIRTESCTATKSGDVLSATITGAWSKLQLYNSAWHFKHGNTYTISAYFDNPSGNKVGICYRKLGASSSQWTTSSIVQTSGKVSMSFTYDDSWGDMVIAFIVNNTNSSTNNSVTVSEMMIELSSIATTYEPYQGTTYAIDWTSEAGTVYHGTVDPVTGQLVVDYASVDLGTLDWQYESSGATRFFTDGLRSSIKFPTNYDTAANAISSMYANRTYNQFAATEKANGTMAVSSSGWLSVRNTAYADVASFTAAMNGQTFVYELATPLTYQLTPTQVAVLAGTNNVWSDGGPITIVYALDEVPQNMPPSTAIFGDIFYTRRNQLSRFGLTFKGWNTVPDGSGEAWLPSGVSMGTYKRTEDAVWNVSHNVTLYAQWDPNVYPFGTVFFNGRNAQDLGIIVEELPSYYYAERAFNHKQVNGKNGDVILDTGRYENVKKVYKVACYDPSRNFYESAVALSTFLHSAGSDYIRLEDSYEPSSYRMAIYEETNEIENLLGKAGRCEITFNCMPQRFLLSGDEEITIPSSGYSIYNPTAFDAKPMIRIQGTGTVTINGRSVQVTENDNDMLVDCENQNAKDLSGADMNYFIYCDEFPILKPGFNTISYTETIDAVKITPRWWIL